MQKWLCLIVGGVCGTLGRYALSGSVQLWLGAKFPYGTLAVNTLGCLAAGFLGTLAEQRTAWPAEATLFWMVGLLGAFTTFSALIYESWRLIQDGQFGLAAANLAGSVMLGLSGLWLGRAAASWF